MDLKGKTCVVTGANTGLGLCTVKRFARLGAAITMVCRDAARGQKALQEVRAENREAELELMVCDLANIGSVRGFVRDFKTSHRPLDVLFNNAAVWKMKHTTTKDGLETMFQVNCLAPFLLMVSLVESLDRSPDPRVINIAAPNKSFRLDIDHARRSKRFSPIHFFFQSKLWLAILSAELSRRLAGRVSVYLAEPGPGKFRSNLTREVPFWLRVPMDLFAKSADRAARTIEFLATVSDADSGRGKIYLGQKARRMPAWWTDAGTAAKVWGAAEALLAGIG